MKAPRADPALITGVLPALSALFVVLVGGQSAFAPETCDKLCRLRYTFKWNLAGVTACANFEIKDCLYCSGAGSLCADYEGSGAGKCVEEPKFEQQGKIPTCTEICTLQKDGSAEAICIDCTPKYQPTGNGPY
ncbi:MAG: hypothetical protein L0215_23135, partial [Gemmataceae bacterium]|nr:hypothetical protein [Gemmataceae bacterium]